MVVLLATTEALKQTRNYCTVEFRDGKDGQFVDVTQVTVGTSMAMEGQPMAGYVTEPARIGRGRYTVQMVLAMSGTWQITIGWSDAAGPKRATFTARIS